MSLVTLLAAEMSYTEIMAMEIRDFFIFLHVYNQRMEEKLKEAEHGRSKTGSEGRTR